MKRWPNWSAGPTAENRFPVALPPDQNAVIVVVLLIRSAVEIGIDGDARQAGVRRVEAPEIRPPVVVPIEPAE